MSKLRAIRKLLPVFLVQGPRAAAHAYREQQALAATSWGDLRRHLSARLNTVASRRGHGLSEVFAVLGSRTVDAVTQAKLEACRPTLRVALRHCQPDLVRDLAEYFRYFGDFRSAEFLRTQALEAYLRLQASLAYAHPLAVKAALELGRPDLVLEILATKKNRRPDWPDLAAAEAMARALTGNVSAANEIWGTHFGVHELAFREFVRGRDIALVGPARPLEANGHEIDSFDVVVRTQYRPGSNEPEELYGKRTDVSYYNHHRISNGLDQVATTAKRLKWVVLKDREDEGRLRNAAQGYQGGVRTLFSADALFFNSHPLAIQNILHDLIRFSPRSIKLFSTDFYSSSDVYGSKNYEDDPANARHVCGALRFHEPFSGYSFVQNLHCAGLCALDRVTAGALALGRERYAEAIDNIYGRVDPWSSGAG